MYMDEILEEAEELMVARECCHLALKRLSAAINDAADALKALNDLSVTSFGEPKTFYALVREYSVRWGCSGDILGVYDDKEKAELAAMLLRAKRAARCDDEHDDEKPSYFVVAIDGNAEPKPQFGWAYYE